MTNSATSQLRNFATPTPSASELAAIRHAVYSDILGCLAPASCEEAEQFVAELGLCGDAAVHPAGSVERVRQVGAVLMRFLTLRVTPDMGGSWPMADIERRIRRKWGNLLHLVPGFARRHDGAPWRLMLPERAVIYPYRRVRRPRPSIDVLRRLPAVSEIRSVDALEEYRRFVEPGFYAGLLIHPIGVANRYWLLSSAQYNGPRATPLDPRVKMYFDQSVEQSAVSTQRSASEPPASAGGQFVGGQA